MPPINWLAIAQILLTLLQNCPQSRNRESFKSMARNPEQALDGERGFFVQMMFERRVRLAHSISISDWRKWGKDFMQKVYTDAANPEVVPDEVLDEIYELAT